jgi:O-glycosyl hydrolase
MKVKILVLLIFTFLLSAASHSQVIDTVLPAPQTPIITFYWGDQHQTMSALGGAIAFFEKYVLSLSPSEFSYLTWRLFEDLRVSGVRIRVRNEIEPVNDNASPDTIKWTGFKPLPDTAAVYLVHAAKSFGHGLIVFATPSSPPGWMKTNDTTINGGHLKPDMEAELAEWLRVFLTIWKNNHGIDVDFLSIQNEPSFPAPYESCIYTPAEHNKAMRVVVPRLNNWGFNNVKIVAPDDLNAEACLAFTDSLLNVPDIHSMLYGFAVHNYSTPYNNPSAKLNFLQQIDAACSTASRPVWLSEYGNLSDYKAGTLAEANLEAQHWLISLTELNCETYMHWQLTETARESDTIESGTSLVTYYTDSHKFYLPKKYYFLKHFTRFIRPGMVRVGLGQMPPGVMGTAFLAPGGSDAVAVILNTSSTSKTVKINWRGDDTLQIWRSNGVDTCIQLPPLIKGVSYFNLTIPDSSIVTLTGRTDVPIIENDNSVQADKFSLEQNYPNPFNPVTSISFSIPYTGNTRLAVYDINGKEVAEIVNTKLAMGYHTYRFDASSYPSGVYFYKLTVTQEGINVPFSLTKKMLLVK